MTKPPTTTAIQTVAVMTKPVARPRPIRRSSNRWLSQLGKIAEPSRSQLHPGITRNAIACSRDMGEIQIVSDGHVTRLSIAATVIIPTPAIAMIRSSTPAARELNRHSRTDAIALDHTTQSSRASGFSLLHMPRKCRSPAQVPALFDRIQLCEARPRLAGIAYCGVVTDLTTDDHVSVVTADRRSGRRRWAVIAVVACIIAAAITTTLIVRSKGDAPSASARGLFPSTWTEPNSPAAGKIFKAAANTKHDLSFDFSVTTPKNSPALFVIICDHGTISTSEGEGTDCTGEAHGLVGVCAGGDFRFSVRVSKPQRATWGLAVYREPPSACD